MFWKKLFSRSQSAQKPAEMQIAEKDQEKHSFEKAVEMRANENEFELSENSNSFEQENLVSNSPGPIENPKPSNAINNKPPLEIEDVQPNPINNKPPLEIEDGQPNPINNKPPLKIEDAQLEGRVIEAISTIFDPEIPVNIYELGLIYNIGLSKPGNIRVEMTLTSPSCPVAGTLPGDVQRVVESVEGAANVEVKLVWDPPWTPEKMTEAAKLELGFM